MKQYMIDEKIAHLNKLIEEAISERKALGCFELTAENKAKLDRFNELSEKISKYTDELSKTYFDKMMMTMRRA